MAGSSTPSCPATSHRPLADLHGAFLHRRSPRAPASLGGTSLTADYRSLPPPLAVAFATVAVHPRIISWPTGVKISSEQWRKSTRTAPRSQKRPRASRVNELRGLKDRQFPVAQISARFRSRKALGAGARL
jgi:hypothetical protein